MQLNVEFLKISGGRCPSIFQMGARRISLSLAALVLQGLFGPVSEPVIQKKRPFGSLSMLLPILGVCQFTYCLVHGIISIHVRFV